MEGSYGDGRKVEGWKLWRWKRNVEGWKEGKGLEGR